MRAARRIGLAGVALLLLGGSAARADHALTPHPVVEGDASVHELQDYGDGTRNVRWLCQATTTQMAVASTGITCQVWQGDEKLAEGGGAGPMNVGATRPYSLIVSHEPFRICWTARAFGLDGDITEDTTGPNCETFA